MASRADLSRNSGLFAPLPLGCAEWSVLPIGSGDYRVSPLDPTRAEALRRGCDLIEDLMRPGPRLSAKEAMAALDAVPRGLIAGEGS